MACWEYMQVVVDRQNTREHEARVRFINDHEVPDWRKGPHFLTQFNKLGDDGWELVTVYVGMGADFYTFKRAKQ